MKKIILTQGKFALVDDEDFLELSKFKWSYDGNYARRAIYINGKQKIIRMHRLLANTPKGMDTDHINRNKLDNRKSNLRVCSRSENKINQNMLSKNTSGFIGVSWSKPLKKWVARISIKNKKTHIGVFNTKEEAAKEYNVVAYKNFGEFARLNKI